MNLGDICICGHIRDVHFWGPCSTQNCPCRQFTLIDLGPELLSALELLCDACDLFVHNEDEAEAIAPAYESARALIEKAKNS